MQDWIYYLRIIGDIVIEKKVEAFLVGGVLRDLFLGRELKDVDIVISKRVVEVARYFADEIDASFVILDQNRDIYRVVKGDLFFDFARMAGESIEQDLGRRDFTINATAFSLIIKDKSNSSNLSDFLEDMADSMDFKESNLYNNLIDPFNGIDDLRSRIIRVTREDVFLKDPLRLWRAFRFMAQLDFKLEQRTVVLMKNCNHLAAAAAKERIREEFVKILKTENTAEIISYMEKEFEFLSTLIPDLAEMKLTGENQHHQEDAWTHSLLVLKILEELISENDCNKIIDGDKKYLLKLSALLHDIGKIVTKSRKGERVHYYGHEQAGSEMAAVILKMLKYSSKEVVFVKKIIRYHMRPMLLYIAENLTDKGKYRFFKQIGSLTPLVLIHSMADKIAAMKLNKHEDEIRDYQKYIRDMLDMYYKYKSKTNDLFLSGKDIRNLLDIGEGPQIGKLLDSLTEAQAGGQVKNREEAVDFLKNISD